MKYIRNLLALATLCLAANVMSAGHANALQKLMNPLASNKPHQWLGADVATSILVSRGRYLWLFGDTILGNSKFPRRMTGKHHTFFAYAPKIHDALSRHGKLVFTYNTNVNSLVLNPAQANKIFYRDIKLGKYQGLYVPQFVIDTGKINF